MSFSVISVQLSPPSTLVLELALDLPDAVSALNVIEFTLVIDDASL